MPWHIAQNHSSCPSSRPWGVVKDADNSLEGCHPTEDAAKAQLAALYAAEADQELANLAEEVVVTVTSEELGGKPSKGTKRDRRLKENKQMPMPMPTPAYAAEPPDMAGPFRKWEGTLVVEGVETGDGREFAPSSLEWGDGPQPLAWQQSSQERHLNSVVVGRIDGMERIGEQIRGWGVLDLGSEAGREVERQMEAQMAGGVSVDVDSVKDADVELVFPQEEDGGDGNPLASLFGPPPDKVVFHRGRIRGATLVALPAFVEARIELMPLEDSATDPAVTAAAIATHHTSTDTGSWDGAANEKRLPSPMSVATARDAYAWMAPGAVTDGMCQKVDLKFIHHDVNADGTPGAANLTACSSGIGILHGGRGGTTIPAADRRGVYNHLAAHLRDAGQTPPPFELEDVLVAAGEPVLPPSSWFRDPLLQHPTAWTVQEDGRVFGHLALWNTCHTSFQDRCVLPPREHDFAFFHLGELATDDGQTVVVGHVSFGTGHAAARLDAPPAVAHYDHTGFVGADICVGADTHGIWVAGALRPGLSQEHLRVLRSATLSGDWRRIGGQLRLIAVLAVNVPGFPVPRVHARFANDNMLALTAAGVVTEEKLQHIDEQGTIRVKRRVVEG